MSGNPEEAAVRAGYTKETALSTAAKLLKNPQNRKMIAELRNVFSDSSPVKAGLKRLAFGSCKDAVILAFAEGLPPSHVIEKLDLFNVSEIKRDKNGGVEIKLCDRLKALEKLYEIENSCSSRDMAADLINALTASSPSEVDSSEN
ncbi:MAG: terminase small subunit [Ruminococcus sp.]|nr:terminase small subunit [Ruminococcus sp.]